VAIPLGLGIGVNTTVFNLFNIVVLEKPTAVEPDRLVSIEPGNGNRVSYANYKDLGASPAFAGMAVTRAAVRINSYGQEPRASSEDSAGAIFRTTLIRAGANDEVI
jgi:hypothetical protein